MYLYADVISSDREIKMKKIIITLLISAFSLVTLSACSTIDGAGKDLQGAGQVISEKANRAKNL